MFDIYFVVEEQRTLDTKNAVVAREHDVYTIPPSYSFTFPSFFFVPPFSIEFICRSHLSRGTCIMDGSRVLNPTFLVSVLLVPRVFPDRRVRPRPGGDFQSQLPPLFPSYRVIDKRARENLIQR